MRNVDDKNSSKTNFTNRPDDSLDETVRRTLSEAPMDVESTLFNYPMFSKMLDDLELNVFFNQNEIPLVSKYPNLKSIKSGFIAMNECLYKKAKEKLNKESKNSSGKERRIEKIYLKAFTKDGNLSSTHKQKIERSIKIFTHSRALCRLFKCWFNIVDYHHRVLNSYPEIENEFLSVIFMVFSSLKEKNIMEMLKDVCVTDKMFDFYKDLYKIWLQEIEASEKEIILKSIL